MKHNVCFYKRYLDVVGNQYEFQGEGVCRNANGVSNDVFSMTGKSLKECMLKCDSTEGCGAVSYFEMGGMKNSCVGTSRKAFIEGRIWKCYTKKGICFLYKVFAITLW